MEQCLDVGPGDRPAGWSGIHGDAGWQHGRQNRETDQRRRWNGERQTGLRGMERTTVTVTLKARSIRNICIVKEW